MYETTKEIWEHLERLYEIVREIGNIWKDFIHNLILYFLYLFVGYESKSCLSLFVGYESKLYLSLSVGYELKFCLSPFSMLLDMNPNSIYLSFFYGFVSSSVSLPWSVVLFMSSSSSLFPS